MISYKLFGNRLVVRALPVAMPKRAELIDDMDLHRARPFRPVPFLPGTSGPSVGVGNPFGEFGSYGKGQVVTIGAPLPEPGEDDALSHSQIGEGEDQGGGPFSEKFMSQFVELMGRAMGSANRYVDTMPPLSVGDVVVFTWHDAALLPDETDLYIVPGRAVVGVVTGADFGQLPGKGGADV